MVISTFLSLSIIGIIVITLSKKKIHKFGLILLFLLTEFFFTNYFAIIHTNYSYVEVSAKPEDYLVYQIFEMVLLPVLVFITISYTSFLKSVFTKGLFVILLAGVLCSLEYTLLLLNIIKYKEWHLVYSFLAYTLIYLVLLWIIYGFQKLLTNEGMVKHDSS